jgi:hypothetical protein
MIKPPKSPAWPKDLSFHGFSVGEIDAAPGAILELAAVELLAATLADQGQLLGAIGAIGEGFEKRDVLGLQGSDFLAAFAVVADLLDAAELSVNFWHWGSGMVWEGRSGAAASFFAIIHNWCTENPVAGAQKMPGPGMGLTAGLGGRLGRATARRGGRVSAIVPAIVVAIVAAPPSKQFHV